MDRTYIQDKKFEKEDLATKKLFIADYENCVFNNCDLSNSDLSQRVFLDCKFNSCNLTTTNLTKIGLKNVKFKDCKLLGLHFDNCDLAGARFERTILEKADLRTSRNYSIDPELNKIKKARCSYPAVLGPLNIFDIEID